jgi:hypothetical protein
MEKAKKAIRWFLQDDDGNYAIISLPNAPLIIMIVSYIVTMIVHDGPVYGLFSTMLHGATFLWSYLEIRQGASPFRRILGAAVMAMVLYDAAASNK